jgi:predicted flavoprotein YhiN
MDAPESKPETVIDAWKAKIGAQQARWKQMTDFSDFGKKKKEIEQRTKAEEVVKVRVVSVDD